LVDSGTTFSLFLPKSKENHNPISEELQPRILFVEHGREMSPLLSEELSSSGYQLETADSSLKAIETIKGNVFDLLIIDLDMGVRATRQILRWLNKFFNNLPVIVLTGLNSMEQVEKLKDFGISSYHQKPFQVETLLKSVTELINRPANE